MERDGNVICLFFKEMFLGDNVEYKCLVINDLGFVFCFMNLKVKVLCKFDFKEKLKGVEVLEGDLVIFEVFIVCNFELNVEWFRGMIKFESDGWFEVLESRDENCFKLIIGDVK